VPGIGAGTAFVGDDVGDDVGLAVGAAVGDIVGDAVGLAVGVAVGDAVGDVVGDAVGLAVGVAVGDGVGDFENAQSRWIAGNVVGVVGDPEVPGIGAGITFVGDAVGDDVGLSVGFDVGLGFSIASNTLFSMGGCRRAFTCRAGTMSVLPRRPGPRWLCVSSGD